MSRRLSWIALLPALLTVGGGCQGRPPPVVSAAAPAEARWDAELVDLIFRDLIGNSGIDLVPMRRRVYLSVLGHDVPQATLDRLRGLGVEVHEGSGFKVGGGMAHGIDRIEMLDPDHAVVSGSWYQNPQTWTDFRYEVVRQGAGRWTIVQRTVTRQS